MFNKLVKLLSKNVGNIVLGLWIAAASFGTIRLTIQLLRSVKNERVKPAYYKVLFFPDPIETCPLHLQGKRCDYKKCHFGHEETALSYITRCLLSARRAIDVCVFTITSQNLVDVLIRKHKDGIIVKVVTDCEMMDLNCSQVEQMRANGIQVRHDKTSYFMHHKFAIVDKTILINGSFNWTNQAVNGNQENVMITDQEALVQPYQTQFEKLWLFYKPKL